MTMAVMFETGCDDNGVAHVRRHVVTGDDDGRGLTLSHHSESNCYRDPLAVVLSWSFDMYTESAGVWSGGGYCSIDRSVVAAVMF